MPQFQPGEAKTAIAPIKVSPSGLSCEAELFLGPDEHTPVATSGRKPFVSTGLSLDVRLPITMPAGEGVYHVFIDLYAEELLIGAYQATEDVVIAPTVAGWVLPTGHYDIDGEWTDPAKAYDGDLSTPAFCLASSYTGGALVLTPDSPINCSKVRLYAASYYDKAWHNADLSIDYYDGAWHNFWSGLISKYTWIEKALGGTKLITGVRVTGNEIVNMGLYELNFWSEG